MLEFVPVRSKDSSLYSELRHIYEESFPLEEQRGHSVQEQAFSDPGYELVGIVGEGALLGLLGVWHLDTCLFVEHLALAPATRGKGLGSKLLKEYLDQVKETLVILEIDPLVDEISCRRAAFYERLGFHLTDYDHWQYSFRKGGDPVSLRIMSYPLEIDEKQYRDFHKEYQDRVMAFDPE